MPPRLSMAVALCLLTASGAVAAPNVTNVTQKGSLLIFPDIDVRGDRSTLVRLSNDGSADADVKCFWMDGNKHRTDFAIALTRNQAFWIDAKTGAGTQQVNRFPVSPANGFDNPYLPGGADPYGAGLLVCYVVFAGVPVKWNHLSGTATVYDPAGAYEYPAFAFIVPTGIDQDPGDCCTDVFPFGQQLLMLDGVNYDACPLYAIGQFSPAGAAFDGFDAAGTRLVTTGCTLNLNQDWIPVWTKLQFDVWSADEIKFTGAYECADSWHETDLVTDVDAGAQNFAFANLGTPVARYRVQGVRSTQCPDSRPVGLLAVQATSLAFGARTTWVGTALTAAGKTDGAILTDAEPPTPEGRIR